MRLEKVSALTSAMGWRNDQAAYSAIAAGKIPAGVVVRVGRSIRINVDELTRWLNAGGSIQGAGGKIPGRLSSHPINNEAQTQDQGLTATA